MFLCSLAVTLCYDLSFYALLRNLQFSDHWSQIAGRNGIQVEETQENPAHGQSWQGRG